MSSPRIRSESRGSSVSTDMREEYEDLLRYAVVVPVAQDAMIKFCASDQQERSTTVASTGAPTVAELSSSRVQPEPARLQPPRPHPTPIQPEGMANQRLSTSLDPDP